MRQAEYGATDSKAAQLPAQPPPYEHVAKGVLVSILRECVISSFSQMDLAKHRKLLYLTRLHQSQVLHLRTTPHLSKCPVGGPCTIISTQ